MNPARLLQHFERISEAPDAIPRLRRFILDLAVRGCLSTEANWVAHSEPLQTVASLQNGYAFKSEWFVPNGIRLLRNANVSHGVLRWDEVACLPEYRIEEFERFRLSEGDVVLSLDRPFIVTGTKVARVRPQDIPCLLLQRVGRFQLNLDRLSSDYLFLWLHSPYFSDQIDPGRSNGVPHISSKQVEAAEIFVPPLAEQHRIVAKVDELMALCDQLEAAKTEREQSRDRLVAASLHSLNSPADAEEDNTPEAFRDHARFYFNHLPRLTTRPEHIKQLRQTILNLAVRGKLVPQDPNDEPATEILKRIEKDKAVAGVDKFGRDWIRDDNERVSEAFSPAPSWIWTRIANAVERVTVGFVGSMQQHYVAEGVPFLRSQNVRANRFRPEGMIYISRAFHRSIMKSALSPGDVVVVRSGNVGTACAIPASLPEANCSDLVVVKRPLALVAEFLCFYLNSLASVHVEEGTVGIALTHFNTKSVATMPIPLPPLAEQHRIVAKVDELMALCDQFEAQLTTTEADSRHLLEAVLHEVLDPALEKAA